MALQPNTVNVTARFECPLSQKIYVTICDTFANSTVC